MNQQRPQYSFEASGGCVMLGCFMLFAFIFLVLAAMTKLVFFTDWNF